MGAVFSLMAAQGAPRIQHLFLDQNLFSRKFTGDFQGGVRRFRAFGLGLAKTSEEIG